MSKIALASLGKFEILYSGETFRIYAHTKPHISPDNDY